MDPTEIEFEANEAEIAARPRKLRWVLRAMLTFCAVLMGMVLLSQPRIAAQVHLSTERLAAMFSTPNDMTLQAGTPGGAGDQDTAAEPDAPTQVTKPMVSVMPKDRVPVRRAGISVLD